MTAPDPMTERERLVAAAMAASERWVDCYCEDCQRDAPCPQYRAASKAHLAVEDYDRDHPPERTDR